MTWWGESCLDMPVSTATVAVADIVHLDPILASEKGRYWVQHRDCEPSTWDQCALPLHNCDLVGGTVSGLDPMSALEQWKGGLNEG